MKSLPTIAVVIGVLVVGEIFASLEELWRDARSNRSALQANRARMLRQLGRAEEAAAVLEEIQARAPGFTVIMGDSHTCTHGAFGAFAAGVGTTDLEVGMRLPGIVTNVTDFGAFIDIGVHQDGLAHISQLVRANDPHHLLTAGWWGDPTVISPYVDILSFHHWTDGPELQRRIDELLGEKTVYEIYDFD